MRQKQRCRLHGGKSTGPRTIEGFARLRQSHIKSGRFSAETVAFDRWRRQYVRNGYRSARAILGSQQALEYLAGLAAEVSEPLAEEMRRVIHDDIVQRDTERIQRRARQG